MLPRWSKSSTRTTPTMTVTAEIGGGRIEAVQKNCPAIDIHGINSYGGSLSIHDRYVAAGATKPYILTEFGPPGQWETAKTNWGAPVELASTEKADFYRKAYEAGVVGAPGVSLGSYAFTWGSKMEATPTWFGMFLPDGTRLAAVDAMTELWSGKPPANRAPTVEGLAVDGDGRFDPGDEVKVRAKAADPDGDTTRLHWMLRREPSKYVTGGDAQPVPVEVKEAIVRASGGEATVRMPSDPGKYRLFVTVYDDAGGAATANTPLLVRGKERAPLPFYVYRDGFDGMPWVPSGWMGATEALEVDGDYPDGPHEGTHCIRMRFDAGLGDWVGVAWQHPANDWGERDGGYDLTGAKYLEVWARGEFGVEKMSIGVGLLGTDKPHPDSDKVTVDDIELTKEWKRYRIRLKRADLSRIKTGFVVVLTGKRVPVTVYLDDVRFVRK